MHTMPTRLTSLALVLTLASASAACAVHPAPIMAASPAEASLSIFVDPEATVAAVQNEQGRPLLIAFHDVLQTSLKEAGYRVVASAASPHDLTIHLNVARLGFNTWPWADGVVLEVTAGGQTVSELKRPTLNWMSMEGHDTPTRLAYAAHAAVNAITTHPRIEQFAATPPGAAVPAPATAPAAAPLAPAAAPAPAPAAPAPAPAT